MGVLVFGGIGLFAARSARHDELEEELVRDLVEGRPPFRALASLRCFLKTGSRPQKSVNKIRVSDRLGAKDQPKGFFR